MTPEDLSKLESQFKGARFAELILRHVQSSNLQQSLQALKGFSEELPPNYEEILMEMLDFLAAMPKSEGYKFFAMDCAEQFTSLMSFATGYFERHNIQISDDEAFTVFNIIVQNYAYSCHRHSSTKAAMQKAAGIGFLRRIFGS